MRIAYISLDYGIPVLGGKGGSVHIREMVEAFCSLGHSVHLFCAHLGAGASLDGPNLTVTEYSAPLETNAPQIEASFDPEHRIWKERRYRRTAALTEAIVVDQHEATPFDLVYERYSLWSATGARVGHRLGIPSVFEVNAPLVEEQAKYRHLYSAEAAVAVRSEILATADVLAAVSTGVADYLVGAGASRDRICVIPNGVNTDSFRPDVEPARIVGWEQAPVVGFTGGLKAWHGLDDLIEAFRMVKATVPSAKLLVVGDGPVRAEVERRAEAEGISSEMLITGWLPHSEIPKYVARMDVAVAPYPAIPEFYFSPLKLFEYLAAGRAIVTTATGQNAEVVRDGENGVVVPPSDPVALGDRIGHLFEDSELRCRLGKAARISAQSRTWEANARRVIEIAGRITGRHQTPVTRLEEASA